MDKKLFESARTYYVLALINILNSLSDDYRSHDSVFRQFDKRYVGNDDYNEGVHSALFLLATRTLLDRSFLEIVSSEFSPPYIRKTANFADAASIPEAIGASEKFKLLGSSGENWLRSTFQSISKRFESD